MCTSTISISMRVYMWQKNVIVEKTDHSSHASALHHLLSSSIFWCCPNWYRIYRYLPFYIQIPQPLSNREGPYSDCKFLTTKFVCQTSRNWHQHQATKFILDASAPNGTKWTSSGRYYILNTQEFCSINFMSKTLEASPKHTRHLRNLASLKGQRGSENTNTLLDFSGCSTPITIPGCTCACSAEF